jgi:hypothetical protein
VDTLSVTLGPGEVVKHFSALDLATRFSLAQVHGRATASLAARLLAELVSRAPFPIRAIQRSLRPPASAWGSGSLCCPRGVLSSTGTWSGRSALSATSFTPGLYLRGLLISRPRWTLI